MGRAKAGGLWGACLSVLALTVVLLFIAMPSSSQLDLVADPAAADDRAQGVPLARAVGKSARFLRKHAAKAAALRASAEPNMATLAEVRPAPLPAVPTAAVSSDPSSYVPPADAAEDGGLFDMSMP
jgi:hypothetical protein